MGKPRAPSDVKNVTSASASTRLGKNKKKNWKRIQHDDVEKFLDEVREDERLGGIRSKPDDELFVIDDVGVHENLDDFQEEKRSAAKLSLKKDDTGPLVDIGSLKCFRLLKPHSAVPDPIIKRNRLRKVGEGKSTPMVLKDEKRQGRKKVPILVSEEPCKDPWAMEDNKTILDSQWIDSSIKRHNLRPRVNKPATHVTSELPAIDVPHPGFSYNPSFRDHQELLSNAVSAAAEVVRKERNLQKTVAPTVCLTVEKSESESDEEVDVKPRIIPQTKPKTRQQKRKQSKEKQKSSQCQRKKQDNVRQNEIFRIKSIQKDIVKVEKAQKEKTTRINERKLTHQKFGQKELSKYKYEALSLDPALSDELNGSLVGVPSHNRLVLDRFNSLQKRNIVEPRIRQRLKRKNRVKKFQKSSEKMEWEKTGHWNGIKVVK